MKLEISYSKELEAARLLQSLYQIAHGFYQKNGFLIVSNKSNLNASNLVKLPEIDFKSMPQIWSEVKGLKYGIPMPIENDTYRILVDILPDPNIQLLDKAKTRICTEWKKVSGVFEAEIAKISCDTGVNLSKVTVNLSEYGTNGSFSRIDKHNSDLIIYLRHDVNVSHIAFCIVTALTRDKIYNTYNYDWSESQAIADWLIDNGEIGRALRQHNIAFRPTLQTIKAGNSIEEIESSIDFCEKYGIDSFKEKLRLGNQQIYYGPTPIGNLMPREKDFLRLLAGRNKLVSLDEASSVIGYSTESFSLYAISKFVQRLRNKLEVQGVNPAIIQTVRGKGFMIG